MSAEIAKVRFLPFPRWTAAAVVGLMVLAGLILVGTTPTDTSWYEDAPGLALNLGYQIAAIVLGVWIATLEFTSGTLQRTLTAEPNRSRVLLDKAVVLCVTTLVIGAAAILTGITLSEIAAQRASVDIDVGDLFRALFGTLPNGVIGALVGFGLGLLTRSMGAGIGLTFALVFIADGFLSALPGISGYTFGQVTTDLTSHLSGTGDTERGFAMSLLLTLAWMVVLMLPGCVQFAKGDLK